MSAEQGGKRKLSPSEKLDAVLREFSSVRSELQIPFHDYFDDIEPRSRKLELEAIGRTAALVVDEKDPKARRTLVKRSADILSEGEFGRDPRKADKLVGKILHNVVDILMARAEAASRTSRR